MYRVPTWGFPGGLVVKTPPGNAGDVGLIPGQGTKVHTATKRACCQLLSSRATSEESLHNKSLHDATKIQYSQINKQMFLKIPICSSQIWESVGSYPCRLSTVTLSLLPSLTLSFSSGAVGGCPRLVHLLVQPGPRPLTSA